MQASIISPDMHHQTKLFGKPVTVGMLHGACERGRKFEDALVSMAQELNEALGNLDYASSEEEASRALQQLVAAARLAVKTAETANPMESLHKPRPELAEDYFWEWHLNRGLLPSDASIAKYQGRS